MKVNLRTCSLYGIIEDYMIPLHKQGRKFPTEYPTNILESFICKVGEELEFVHGFNNPTLPFNDMLAAEKELKNRGGL